ncbi:MAG: polyphosphate kinase 2 family protein [Thermomicrobiales bacterium]|nr:polyphosphate kinase 2 family protein [Thermomicrobiales bacterium]MCO5217407.1 polyphosphate kinase 2 family protein [Thermomicrobiales bacterium]MCO5226710.1 polyphosphate kinase 2 family protein [Thermomicrobiales bacterium]
MNPDDYRIAPKSKVDLSGWNAADHADIQDKELAKAILKENRKVIIDLQERLYAENAQSILVCFQAMDTGGKDGCIENVFKGVNPSGCRVRSFKVPNSVETSHDFLWRYHQHTPRTGIIQVFNRSHYEDVLVVRVKGLVPKSVWEKRYEQINHFEEVLEDRGTRILKFYLHISKDEQKRRIESRLEDPAKHWKYSEADLKEREYWDDYQKAFEAVLERCSTKTAPWYVVPANHKWYRDVVVSTVIRQTLEEMDPQFPKGSVDVSQVTVI